MHPDYFLTYRHRPVPEGAVEYGAIGPVADRAASIAAEAQLPTGVIGQATWLKADTADAAISRFREGA